VMVILKTTRPHVAVLANIHGTHFYRNIDRFGEDVILKEDILIVRFDAQLYFANTSFFKDKLEELVIEKGDKLRLIVIDCESMNSIDSSGIHMLEEIIDDYHSKNLIINFSGVKGPVRDAMEKGGLLNKIGLDHFYMSIQEAVDSYESRRNNMDSKQKFKKFLGQTNT